MQREEGCCAFSSRRAAAGRAELLANFCGGAVLGVFLENANCGDPPGQPPGNLAVPCTFRRGLIWKIRQKSGKIWENVGQTLAKFVKISEIVETLGIFSAIFDENFEH